MHPNTRALVAAAAVRLAAGGGNSGAIYDYSQSRHIQISGSASDGVISLYDYDRGCHFSGSGGSLYDYGRGLGDPYGRCMPHACGDGLKPNCVMRSSYTP